MLRRRLRAASPGERVAENSIPFAPWISSSHVSALTCAGVGVWAALPSFAKLVVSTNA